MKRSTKSRPRPLQVDQLTMRDHLAIDRTRLANERTLLSFIRTALYFSIMGITVIKLEFLQAISWTSLPFFVLSGILFIIGIIMYSRTKRSIRGLYTDKSLS